LIVKENGVVSGEPLDYRQVFELCPIACAVLDQRTIVDCNELFASIWRGTRAEIIGLSFAVLYAGESDFDMRGKKIGPILAKRGSYSDNWLMKRLNGEMFWSHVSGTTVDRRAPYARAIWTFLDLSVEPQMVSAIRASLTPREREIAMLLLEGCSSKEIARRLEISPRTVHVHRASLLRKYSVSNTVDLCKNLLTL
jgi:DNA-binding CsgD family transcriptional regulator